MARTGKKDSELNILFIQHRYHSNLYGWFQGLQGNQANVQLIVYRPDDKDIEGLPKSTFLEPSKLSKKLMNKRKRTRGDGVDSFSPFYFPSIRNLHEFFRTFKPDVIVIRPVFTRFGYLLLALSLLLRVKVVFHSRIAIYRHFDPLKLIAFKSFMTLLGAYWISPCKGDESRYKLSSKRLIYMPFTIRSNQNERDYFNGNRVNILCVAKYFENKNPKLMLDAFLELLKTETGIKLTIVGTGDDNGPYFNEMLAKVRDSQAEEYVDILINQPQQQMERLYIGHDIFVLPTNHDPASFTVLEAMSYGLATLTTDVDGSAGYITDGFNGFIIPKGNLRELVSKLKELIQNKNRIVSQGQNSLKLTRKNHDPIEVTANFLNRILG